MLKDDDNGTSSGKFITTFSDSGKKNRAGSGKSGGDPEGTSFLDSSAKGKYALVSALGFGLIALIFIFFLNHNVQVIGLTLVAMGLLGAKAFFLAYPKVAPVGGTSTVVKSYFLTGIFLMAWIIFTAWAFQYLVDADDITDDYRIDLGLIVALSILTLVSVFFITMTRARR